MVVVVLILMWGMAYAIGGPFAPLMAFLSTFAAIGIMVVLSELL